MPSYQNGTIKFLISNFLCKKAKLCQIGPGNLGINVFIDEFMTDKLFYNLALSEKLSRFFSALTTNH